VLLDSDPAPYRDDLERRFPEIRFHAAVTGEAVPQVLSEHQPQAVFSVKKPDFEESAHRVAANHPSVVWVHVGGSGYEHIAPWDPARTVVTNSAGVLARSLAETVIGAMLSLNGNLLRYAEQQRSKVWRSHTFCPVSEKVLLVVGLGRIGTHVAAAAKALGMRVIAVRRRMEPHPSVDALYPPEALLEIVGQADVVSLHVRLTEATRHLIDARALSAMKPGAMLINTSRGPVVDEAALVNALSRGHLGSAYLDVFEVEPLPASSKLWSMHNVLITPHAADNVLDWPRKFAELFAENLNRWQNGEDLLNIVSSPVA